MGADMVVAKRRAALFGVISLLLLAACAQPPGPPSETAPPQFGWIDGNCLATESQIAQLPRTIAVSRADGSPELIEATVTGEVGEGDTCNALMADRAETNRAAGNRFYTIESAQPIESGIAVVGAAPDPSWTYAQCLTSEGVSFSVSDGTRTVWEGYEYLGYDVEPTCTSE